VRRLALLIAAGSLWLFLAAVPALADGGPHVASANSGVSTLTADTCAGCHRAHTAKGEALINADTQEELCLNCHGSAGTGASVNVEDGVQYTLASRVGTGGVVLGALRDGGFVNARIDSANPMRATYLRTATDASFRAKVPVGDSAATTSAHLSIGGSGVALKNVAWGNGAAGSGVGATATSLECTSCHNPHGNGQYRILNTMASLDGNGFINPVSFTVNNAYAQTERFFTSTAHGLVVGDLVTISGLSGVSVKFGGGSATTLADGVYVVSKVPTGTSFQLSTAPTKTAADLVNGLAVDIQADSLAISGATLKRYAALVDDAPLPGSAASGVASTVERNYTIQQIRGYQGNAATYILYASQLPTSTTVVPVNFVADLVGASTSVSITINGVSTPFSNVFTTSLAHGFAVGDTVTIAGLTTNSGVNGPQTIATIPSSTTFTLTGITPVDETAPVLLVSYATSGALFTSGSVHGLAVGDTVVITGFTTNATFNGTWKVATAPSTTTFTLTGVTGGSNETGAATKFASVPGAKIGTAAKSINGTFGPTSGDYFHRTVPWNPQVSNPTVTANGVATTCNTYSPPTGGLSTPADFSSGCLTAQDAPNGRPASVTGGLKVNSAATNVYPSSYGQVAFNDQVSAWCSTCHTRYYSSTNPNPGGEPSSTADIARNVTSTSGATITLSSPDAAGNLITTSGFSVGDIVKFTGGTYATTTLTTGQWYVVTVSSTAKTFSVSATIDGAPVTPGTFTGPGTVVRAFPGSASSWYFSRPGDTTYKYQHQTTTNRSCVTCHVSHGTDASMPGTFSGSVKYPDGSAGTGTDNSRLLKVDNRGTCQMCHDPTGTMILNPGAVYPSPAPTLVVP
jgi:predicted CXXCH cytochrome family protein